MSNSTLAALTGCVPSEREYFIIYETHLEEAGWVIGLFDDLSIALDFVRENYESATFFHNSRLVGLQDIKDRLKNDKPMLLETENTDQIYIQMVGLNHFFLTHKSDKEFEFNSHTFFSF